MLIMWINQRKNTLNVLNLNLVGLSYQSQQVQIKQTRLQIKVYLLGM